MAIFTLLAVSQRCTACARRQRIFELPRCIFDLTWQRYGATPLPIPSLVAVRDVEATQPVQTCLRDCVRPAAVTVTRCKSIDLFWLHCSGSTQLFQLL